MFVFLNCFIIISMVFQTGNSQFPIPAYPAPIIGNYVGNVQMGRPMVNQIMVGTNNLESTNPMAGVLASSATIIRTPATTAIVDVGWAYDNRKLLNTLAQKRVLPSQFDFAIHTHGHGDHMGNLNVFTGGTMHISPGMVSKHNRLCAHPVLGSPPGTAFRLDNWTSVMSTGGGDTVIAISVIVEQATVFDAQDRLVYTGTVASVGDLILDSRDFNGTWSTTFSPDPQRKTQSLAALFCPNGINVGYVIPGHGGGFAVTEVMRTALSSNCGGVSFQPQRLTVDPNWRLNRLYFSCNQLSYS